MEDRCVVCGEVVPEGRQVCPNCFKKYMEEPWRREISMDKTVLNGSGCVDKVAHEAINNVAREEKAKEKKMHDREEAAETLIKTLKNTVWLSGFKLIGRIQLEDPKTGRKYL